MATVPHEREKMFLDDIINDCLEGRDKLIVVITTPQNSLEWLIRESITITENLDPLKSRRIRIYRQGLEFDNGAAISFINASYNHALRGLHPDRIIIGGQMGELYYMMLSSGAKIEAIA